LLYCALAKPASGVRTVIDSAATRNNPFSKHRILVRHRDPICLVSLRGILLRTKKLNGDFIMTKNTKIALATALFAAFATPVLAQDEWTVDSGRYIEGQVPSYTTQAPVFNASASRLIEGRSAAVLGINKTNDLAPSDRDSIVQSLGN
jgi:hypothetical protein